MFPVRTCRYTGTQKKAAYIHRVQLLVVITKHNYAANT